MKKTVRGFSINGKNEINAVIEGKKILIAANPKSGFIYFGWKSFTEAKFVEFRKTSCFYFYNKGGISQVKAD